LVFLPGNRSHCKKIPASIPTARARVEKRRANRGALPAHLPRVDVTIEPEDTNCACCSAPMHLIGEETSQRPGFGVGNIVYCTLLGR
jgi:hypothetical protein